MSNEVIKTSQAMPSHLLGSKGMKMLFGKSLNLRDGGRKNLFSFGNYVYPIGSQLVERILFILLV